MHECIQPCQFIMIQQECKPVVEDTEHNLEQTAKVTSTETMPEQMEVSVHAIEGFHTNKTITLTGRRGHQNFSILIDGGSTHSFLYEHTATKLRCELVQTRPMKVQVANGNHLVSQYECRDFSWKIDDKEFKTAVRTLPMGGYDLVLGVDWIGSFGLVTFDYKKLLLQFQYQGKRVTLKGNSHSNNPRIQQMSAKGFVRTCQRQGHGFIYVVNRITQPRGQVFSCQEEDTMNLTEEQI